MEGIAICFAYKGSQKFVYDWLHPIGGVISQDAWPKSCDEPVETIDWLSLSLRWHVAYIVAASPNPQPRDDVLYKDSV